MKSSQWEIWNAIENFTDLNKYEKKRETEHRHSCQLLWAPYHEHTEAKKSQTTQEIESSEELHASTKAMMKSVKDRIDVTEAKIDLIDDLNHHNQS